MNTKQTLMSLAIVAGLALAGPSLANDHAKGAAAKPMSSEQPGTDTWITTKVKADLLASGGVPGTDISVETKNGVVWLGGHVASQAEKDRAITKAKAIQGVKSVNSSKLMVGAAADHKGMDHKGMDHKDGMAAGTGSDQPGSDAWITTKVKADLLASGGVSGRDTKVETKNGVVMLSGNVGSQAEKDRAIATAKLIKGVKSVQATGLKVGK